MQLRDYSLLLPMMQLRLIQFPTKTCTKLHFDHFMKTRI